jgi:hypothetical protein
MNKSRETPEEEGVLISQEHSFMRIGTAVTLARGAYYKFESLPPYERLEKILSAFHEVLDDDEKIPQDVKDNFLGMLTRYYREKLEI